MSTKLTSVIANKAQQPTLKKMATYKVERKSSFYQSFLLFTGFFGIGGWENQTHGMDYIFNFIPRQCFWSLHATTETNK